MRMARQSPLTCCHPALISRMLSPLGGLPIPSSTVHYLQMPSAPLSPHNDATSHGLQAKLCQDEAGTLVGTRFRYNAEDKENPRCTCPPRPILFSRSIERIVSSVKRYTAELSARHVCTSLGRGITVCGRLINVSYACCWLRDTGLSHRLRWVCYQN